jgi:hypothetical protein
MQPVIYQSVKLGKLYFSDILVVYIFIHCMKLPPWPKALFYILRSGGIPVFKIS